MKTELIPGISVYIFKLIFITITSQHFIIFYIGMLCHLIASYACFTYIVCPLQTKINRNQSINQSINRVEFLHELSIKKSRVE